MKSGGFTALLLATLWSLSPVPAVSAQDSQWHFNVLLDGKPIGQHSFRLTNETYRQSLASEADFLVKFLFINAYYYEHKSTEYWDGDCLQQIESHTLDNSKRYRVSGKRQADGFRVSSSDKDFLLPECIMTFAYWNPKILTEKRLLNSQTGEYMPVQVEFKGEENLTGGKQAILANRFDLRADRLRISLWYEAESRQWLALESVTKDNHILRYELIEGGIKGAAGGAGHDL